MYVFDTFVTLTNSLTFILRVSLGFRGQWALGGHQGMAFQERRYKQHSYYMCQWLHALPYITFDYCSKCAEIQCFHTYTHRVMEAFLGHVEREETRETMENRDLLDQW